MNLFSNSINDLERALNYSSMKQKIISNNIANVDTPNYKAKTVSFKSELNEAIIVAKRTNDRHFEFHTSKNMPLLVQAKQEETFNHNGNSVDIDREMADLAKNQIYYNSLIEKLNTSFQSLNIVIRGGR